MGGSTYPVPPPGGAPPPPGKQNPPPPEPAEDVYRNQSIISENFGGGIMDEGDSERITEREIPLPEKDDL